MLEKKICENLLSPPQNLTFTFLSFCVGTDLLHVSVADAKVSPPLPHVELNHLQRVILYLSISTNISKCSHSVMVHQGNFFL